MKGKQMSKAKEKKPVGRPKFEINEEVLKRTENLMAQGFPVTIGSGIMEERVGHFFDAK